MALEMSSVRVILIVVGIVGLVIYLTSMVVAREYQRGNVSRTIFRIWQGASALGLAATISLSLYVTFAHLP